MSETTSIDPRFESIARLVDDLSQRNHEYVPETHQLIFERLLECIDWRGIDADALAFALETLFEASSEEVRNELALVADDEHRNLCACCRRKYRADETPHEEKPAESELEKALHGLREYDPKMHGAVMAFVSYAISRSGGAS